MKVRYDKEVDAKYIQMSSRNKKIKLLLLSSSTLQTR